MFIESSSPRLKGDVARLLSDRFKVNPTFNWCLTFWYHMYGNSVGTLAVRLKIRPYSLRPRYLNLWQAQGNHGDVWLWNQLSVNSGKDFQVRFVVGLAIAGFAFARCRFGRSLGPPVGSRSVSVRSLGRSGRRSLSVRPSVRRLGVHRSLGHRLVHTPTHLNAVRVTAAVLLYPLFSRTFLSV